MSQDKANVLLVDDRPENLVALEAVLEPLGHNLVKVTSGMDALKRLLSDDFALILMDVQMPGLDGFETAAVIKQRERSRHIPIIFLSAASRHAEQVFRGYEAGAVDYIVKPYDPAVLRSKVEVFIDLHDLKRHAEQLAHRAVHDPLTGLPNRVLFTDRLEVALAGVGRRTGRVAVLFFDLDGFKLVNDTLGHDAGDQLLCMVAERVSRALRPADTVARFGGDEFTAMAEIADERDAIEIAERISQAIAAPYPLGAGDAFVSTSVGIAIASGPEQDAEVLIREADTAMYRAKQRGGARHELYDADMRARALRRLETENALRRGLEHDEFRVLYQPVVAVAGRSVVGVEALLRWEHPELGITSPGDFLGLAEDTSLIVPIGMWALEEALRQGQRWRQMRPDSAPLQIAVNVTRHQLSQPGFVDSVVSALGATATEPQLLCLELSEGALVDNGRSPVPALAELRKRGVRLALDDFGTGYSSLRQLRTFPVDALKVDPSFVGALGERLEDSQVVAAIVDLAHALGFSAVAEGVETEDQLDGLRALRCDLAQGTYLGVPMPADSVIELLDAQAVRQTEQARAELSTAGSLETERSAA